MNLPYTAEDGTKPLVVTTPGEYISSVVARVDELGGSANIALAEARKFTVFAMEDESTSASDDDARLEEVNKDMSMGMFWLKASSRAHRSSTWKLRNSGTVVPSRSEAFLYA